PARKEQLAFFRSVLDGNDSLPSRSVRLEVREDRATVAAVREEAEWPLARTKWTPLYLAGAGILATSAPVGRGARHRRPEPVRRRREMAQGTLRAIRRRLRLRT